MTPGMRVRIYELEDEVAGDLETALGRMGVQTVNEKPQVVFCSVAPRKLEKALRRFPRLPVIVVSRLPDVRAWLDALEAGAADYCAAPFESIHLDWMLSNHAGARTAAA